MRRLITKQEGFTLIEVLVAIAILGIIGVGFLLAMAGAYKGNILADERATADSLARLEMEYVKTSPYIQAPWSYTIPGSPPSWDASRISLPSESSNYSIDVQATLLHPTDDGIQVITITVNHQGNPVLTLSNYKVDRGQE